MDLHAFLHFQKLQAGAHGWMFNRPVLNHILDFRIRYTAVILKEGRQIPARNKARFIDRGG